MSNELMIPGTSEVPAYVKNAEAARQANEDMAAGISTGFPARIKISGKGFALVDGNGEEKPYPPGKMVTGPDDNVYMPIVVLKAKPALQKTWYAKKFNPNQGDNVPPDCFSLDSLRPDATAPSPQCDSCAMCPHNAFGSGTDQDGNATKGKACSDTKLLAVFVPGFGVHAFKIPPASLKTFGLYVKQLSANSIPVDKVKTLVGFDLTMTFPVLVFSFGGFIPETAVPKLIDLAESVETEEIVNPVVVAAAPKAIAAAAEKAVAIEVAPETVTPPPADDLGLGLELGLEDVAAKTEAVEKVAPVLQADAELVDAGGTKGDAGFATDDELSKSLGL